MSSTTADHTIATMRHLFASHGLPRHVVSDNGPQFTSSEFAHFMTQNDIKHIRSAPYHPSCNGAAEHFIQTFKNAIRAGKQDERSLKQQIDNFLLT
jgi:transposase InsO family protein